MGVIETFKWVGYDSLKIEKEIISELKFFGLNLVREIKLLNLDFTGYRIQKSFENLRRRNIWHKVQEFYLKYKEIFDGPDTKIFIFPAKSRIFEKGKKSGFAFNKFVFLFIPMEIEDRELEALFVHEYHHTCRLNKLTECKGETLLDYLIMEGQAECAVEEYCGSKYLAPWIKDITTEHCISFYDKYYKDNLQLCNVSPLFNKLMYGGNNIPLNAGYAVGYYLVKKYIKKTSINVIDIIFLKAEEFI